MLYRNRNLLFHSLLIIADTLADVINCTRVCYLNWEVDSGMTRIDSIPRKGSSDDFKRILCIFNWMIKGAINISMEII